MRKLPDRLFCLKQLVDVFSENIQRAKSDVDEICKEQFLGLGNDEILSHILSQREIVPLVIHEDELVLDDPAEMDVDVTNDKRRAGYGDYIGIHVPGFLITVRIPYEGDCSLWQCQPHVGRPAPRGNVKPGVGENCGTVEIVKECPADTVGDGSEIKAEVENIICRIREYLGVIKKNVEHHNEDLRGHIQSAINARRKRLGVLGDVIKTLDIPLRRKPGAPDISALPMKRKIVKPLPTSPQAKQEHGIANGDYEHILKVIRHEGCSYESTPQTFIKLGEEDLRNIILAHLNGHYEGDATGETFRGKGKTDIRVEFQNRAAFVGECKLWHGPKEVGEAVDQLLGYLTWRDCKAALVFFNKDVGGFAALQHKLPEVLKAHANIVRPISTNEAGEWRFVFRSGDDEDRHITVHVFLFNLYHTEKAREPKSRKGRNSR